MLNPYKEYLVTKYNYQGSIEEDGAFLLYRIINDSLNIGELFIPERSRRNGVATKLADKATEIARENNLKFLTCQTELTGKGDNISMMAILSYGFIPVLAEQNKIQYYKEVK